MDKYTSIKLGGVGEILGFRTGEDAVWMGRLENVELTISGNTVKKHGGTGAFPIATWTPEKEIVLTADEALLSLQAVRSTQGDTAVNATELRAAKESATVASDTYEVTVAASEYEAGKTMVLYADGTAFERVAASSDLGEGKYFESVASDGTLLFASDDASESVVVRYVYTYTTSGLSSDDADAAAIVNSGRACALEVYYLHTLTDCGATNGIEMMFYQARPTGELTVKMEHGGIADVSNEKFDIEDPLRADGHLGYILVSQS